MRKRCWFEGLAGVRLSGAILTRQSRKRFKRICASNVFSL